MAWIEAHQELPRHPKTKRFARILKISIPQAVGHLFMFWWWALDYAENGDLTRYDADDIADAAQWDGDPEEFLNAMIACGPGGSYGFIEKNDSGMFVHDWEIYSGRLVEKREKNRLRQAQGRKLKAEAAAEAEKAESEETVDKPAKTAKKKTTSKTSKSVSRDKRATKKSVASESQGYTTEHNRTQQNNTEQNITQHDTTEPNTSLPPTTTPEAAEAVREINLGELVNLWNTLLAPLGFTQVLKQTPYRQRAFNELLENAEERRNYYWWEGIFNRVCESDFLCASVKGKNWFTIDWVLNESNLVKLVEGRYDNRKKHVEHDNRPLTIEEVVAQYHKQLEQEQAAGTDAANAENNVVEAAKEGGTFVRERPRGLLWPYRGY